MPGNNNPRPLLTTTVKDPILGLALVLGDRKIVPYVPTREELIPRILDELDLGPDDVFYDIGCGDGRVAVYAAKYYGVRKSICIEIDKYLVEEALKRSILEGVADRVSVINADFNEVNVSDATAVYLYLLTSVNDLLKPKLEKELRPGTRVAALDFPVPGWRPFKKVGIDEYSDKTLYLYIIGSHNMG